MSHSEYVILILLIVNKKCNMMFNSYILNWFKHFSFNKFQVEDDAFEGLDSLETLSLQDNNILLVPASALGRLPKLTALRLDFNRVAALSVDILRAVADRVMQLGLARNVVRELPSDAFQVTYWFVKYKVKI